MYSKYFSKGYDAMEETISLQESSQRLKLWEIDSCFRCPVIGACLSSEEQLSLLKKNGNLSEDSTPYQIHEALVSIAGNENSLSRCIDAMLQRKYVQEMSRHLALAPDAFVEQFRVSLPSGQMAGVLWAAAVRHDLGLNQKREIFGELHMTMHTSQGELSQFVRLLERAENEVETLKLDLKQAKTERRMIQKETDVCRQGVMKLQNALASAECDRNRLQRELDNRRRQDIEVNTAVEELRAMKTMFAEIQRQFEDAIQYTTALEEENSDLRKELGQIRDPDCGFPQFHSEHSETREFLNTNVMLPPCRKCDECCPVSDLCQKRILIVGGIERMESRYRKLIEGGGGIMEYHDGHVNRGARELECRLKRADMVLCPINCNSHAACLIIKKLGKKYSKPVCMLANFSLSAVSRAIWNEDRTSSVN